MSEEKEMKPRGDTNMVVGETKRTSKEILTRFYYFFQLLKKLELACIWTKFSWFISGVVLPFEPATITFENVQYYVDTPKVLKLYLLLSWLLLENLI